MSFIIRSFFNSRTTDNQEMEMEEIVPVKRQHLTFTVNDQFVPDDVTLYIFKFLSPEALEVAGLVCKHFYKLANTDFLLKNLTLSKNFARTQNDQDSYRDFYRKTIKQEYFSLINKAILKEIPQKKLIEEFRGTSLFSIETHQKILDHLNVTASKLLREDSATISGISPELKNDPVLNAQLLFLIVSRSGALLFLKDLVKDGKAIVPTQEVCKSAAMDPLLQAVNDKNHAMLEYLLNTSLIPTQEHLNKAIRNSDVRSVELLLNANAPIARKNFVYLLTHTTDSKLITIEGLQLFKLLCQACANRKVIPKLWNKNKVRNQAKKMDKVLQDKLANSRQRASMTSPLQSEIDWTKREENRLAFLKEIGQPANPSTYEEYVLNIKAHNEMINRSKMFIELKQAILPDGYMGELKKAGLLTEDSSKS
jgi:hypothetical protein